jgi:hypothetical protein
VASGWTSVVGDGLDGQKPKDCRNRHTRRPGASPPDGPGNVQRLAIVRVSGRFRCGCALFRTGTAFSSRTECDAVKGLPNSTLAMRHSLLLSELRRQKIQVLFHPSPVLAGDRRCASRAAPTECSSALLKMVGYFSGLSSPSVTDIKTSRRGTHPLAHCAAVLRPEPHPQCPSRSTVHASRHRDPTIS